MPESAFSYVLQDWDQSFCVEQAFGPSAEVIKKILGLRQSVDSLERMNVDMSKQVLDYRAARPAPKPAEEGVILVTSADGKGIVMRHSEEEKAEKKHKTKAHRGKGEKANQKRMATVGAVYTVDRYFRTAEQVVAALFRDEEPRPWQKRPAPQHKHVWGSLPVAGDDDEMISGMNVVYSWLQQEVEDRSLNSGRPVTPNPYREFKGDEVFYLDLFGLSNNALFGKKRGFGTILNDD